MSDYDHIPQRIYRPLVQELGLRTIIDTGDQVDQNEYSDALQISFTEATSGEITDIVLITGEEGTGAVLEPDGTLLFFDADPSISAGDSAMSAAARTLLVGKVDIVSADWDSDANGASAHFSKTIAFHSVSSLFIVFQLLSATSFNDGAGDDEFLKINLWYREGS